MTYYLIKLTKCPKIIVASGYSTDKFYYKFPGGIKNAEIILIEKSDIIARQNGDKTLYPTGSLVTLAYDIQGEYTSSDGKQSHISVDFSFDSIERLDSSGVVKFANLFQNEGTGFKTDTETINNCVILPEFIPPDENTFKWRGYISKIIAEHSIISLSGPIKTTSLLFELLYELTEYSIARAKGGNTIKSGAGKYYKKAVLYIADHLDEELYVENIAVAAEVSYGYLNRIFKSETGESVFDYINHARIARVCEILQTKKLTIEEICPIVGYTDVKYLSRIFKKHTGVTMSEYRAFWKDNLNFRR
jgi:AraC-type DNA-binding domain-containing proteins